MKSLRSGDRRYRLLHLQPTATFGGDESNSLLLCRHLPELRHSIGVYFGSGPMVSAWSEAGAHVSVLDLDPAGRRAFMRAIRETVATVQPDGIFVASVSLLPLVLSGLDGFGGPVLCHTGNPDSSSALTRFKFWIARTLLRPTARATLVHCSDYVRRSYLQNLFYRRYRHEVAVSTGLFDMERAGERPHLPRPRSIADAVRVGMLARLDPIKNHRLVIRAFRAILDAYPKAALELIGEGSERANLEAEARAAGVADRVRFLGRVPNPFPVIREWDLFLYGTTAAEGYGAALAEAMALGMPCVVTEIGPMREVGGDGGAVCYVEPGSPEDLGRAAIALIGDHGERARMSAAARERARDTFGGARFAGRMAQLLGLGAETPRESRAGSAVA